MWTGFGPENESNQKKYNKSKMEEKESSALDEDQSRSAVVLRLIQDYGLRASEIDNRDISELVGE